MKKLIAILAVVALTAPCLAAGSLDITAVAAGDTLTVGYANATGGVPVGLSMEVNITSGDGYVNSAADVSGGADGKHEVYIDYVNSNPGSGYGVHPIALIGGPGAPSLPTAGGADFALCMGELATTPGTSGTLAVIKFTKGTTSSMDIQLQADTSNRGGVVDENGDAMTVSFPGSVTVTFGCATCQGDLDNDNVVGLSDFLALFGILDAVSFADINPGDPGWHDCGDVDNDNVIGLSDFLAMFGALDAVSFADIPCPAF